MSDEIGQSEEDRTDPSLMKPLSVGQSNRTSNARMSSSVGRPGMSSAGGCKGGPWVMDRAYGTDDDILRES